MRKQIRYIILNALLIILMMLSNPALAQQEAFTGTVTDFNGKPVRGVELTIKEKPGETFFTNDEGKFALTAMRGQHLVLLTMGNVGKQVVLDQNILSIVLDPSSSKLINLGYGETAFQNDLGASVSTVEASQLGKSSALDPENALYGLLPGLAVMQNGGEAGLRSPDMYIRGRGTMNNSNILVLVDGFERPMSSLSIDEIQSVSVLKDAAALAQYGQRGANGVLLVTTKRGENDALKVNVSYQYGINQAFRLPTFYGAADYANALNEALSNDGLAPRYSSDDIAAFKSGNSPYLFPNVDWFKETLRDYGTNSNFNATFSGGGKRVRYFTSLNYQNEEGLMAHANDNIYSTQFEYDRMNFRTNLDIDLTKNTLFHINVAGNIYNQNRPGTQSSAIFDALYTIPSAAFPVKTLNNQWGGTTIYDNNPVALSTATGYAKTHSRTILFDASIRQDLSKILKGLTAEVSVAYDNSATYWDGKTKSFQYETTDIQRDPATGSIADTIYTIYGQDSPLNPYSSLGGQWRHGNFWGKLNYFNSWGKNTLGAMLLYQQDKKVENGQYHTYLHQSMVGNVRFSNSDKYYAAATLSYSGSSVLPKNDRFGFFPAVSAAWLINKESFLASSNVIKLLKLRASWGITGNDLMSPNLADQGYYSGNGYYFTQNDSYQGGYYEGRLATSQLTYEKSYKTNVGIDANLFGKLAATFDVFYNKRNDILVSTEGNVSSVIGVNPAYANLGQVRNEGLEASLKWSDQIGDFSYHLGGQFSFAKNEILNMAESYQPYDYLKHTGRPIGQVFGLQAIGFFSDAGDISNSPKQLFSNVVPGDIKYKDQNGDNVIDQLDEVPIGYSSGYPTIYYSMNLGLEYKGFGLDAVFQGVADQTLYLNTKSVFWPLRGNTTISTFSNDRWTPATSATATLPRLTTTDNNNDYRPNTIWMRSGNYLKLRTAEVYYTLPKQLVDKVKLRKARIFLRGMNLFSIDKVKVMDPEELGTGYPTLKSYFLGVNVAF